MVRLTISQGSWGASQSRILRCEPTGGNHPTPFQACARLNTTRGQIIRPSSVNCPRIYRPVTATAFGYWRGYPVRFNRTFSNSCIMRAQTGAVFNF